MSEIIWSKRAEHSFDLISEYIRTKFTQKEEDYFVISVVETLTSISHLPKAFPESKQFKNARRVVIHPHTTLFYRTESKKSTIIHFLGQS